MDRFDGIEKLRERAQVTYEEAKEAYDWAEGDLLEALIYLEKQGKIKPPQGDGYYSSKQEPSNGERTKSSGESEDSGERNNFKENMRKFGQFCFQIIQKGNSTSFEVLKEKEHVASFPVTVLVLLLIFAFWVTLPLMFIGLFFGYHYQFVSNE